MKPLVDPDTGPAAPVRDAPAGRPPLVVSAALYLAGGLAAAQATGAVGAFYAMPQIARHHSELRADGLAGDWVAAGLLVLTLVSLAVAAGLAALALFGGRGGGIPAVRLGIWVLAGLAAGLTMLLLNAGSYAVVPWYRQVTMVVGVATLILALAVAVLLALPPAGEYFRWRGPASRPPAGPGKARRATLLSALPLAVLLALGGCTAGAPSQDGAALGPPRPQVSAAPEEHLVIGPKEAFREFNNLVEWEPDTASLVGPWTTFRFGGVTVKDRITAQQVAALQPQPANQPGVFPAPAPSPPPEGQVAAPDQEFLVLQVVEQTQLCTPTDFVEETEASIRSGERTYRLDQSLVEWTGLCHGDGATLLLSVPKGAPVALELSEADRTQSLDLRSGKRGKDAIDGYYPRREATVEGDLSGWTPVVGVPVPGAFEGNVVSVAALGVSEQASLVPYGGPRVGWAEPGRAWLMLSVESIRHSARPPTRLVVDAEASFWLTLPGGGRDPAAVSRRADLRPEARSATDPDLGPPDGIGLLFDVPDDFRSGVLQFVPIGDVIAGDRRHPRAARLGQAADTLTITLDR